MTSKLKDRTGPKNPYAASVDNLKRNKVVISAIIIVAALTVLMYTRQTNLLLTSYVTQASAFALDYVPLFHMGGLIQGTLTNTLIIGAMFSIATLPRMSVKNPTSDSIKHNATAAISFAGGGNRHGSTTTTVSTMPTTTTVHQSCSGTLVLGLAPNPAAPSSSVSATVSGLTQCSGQSITIKSYQGCTSGTTIATISSGASGGSATITSPGSAGTYGYWACIDGMSSESILTVSATKGTGSTTSTTTTTTTSTTRTSSVATTVPASSTVGMTCSTCFGLFPYIVQSGDTLSLIASHYGLSATAISSFNNISSVYIGEQIMLPFSVDTIETDISGLTNQNAYDYYLLMYAAAFHLNPMLIKAEIYDESGFNSTAISGYDDPPGVCGTGHSYGLLQYTPACFGLINSFGLSGSSPNSEVLYGQNNGPAQIVCTSSCTNGDYLASEYSDVMSRDIVSELIESSQFAGWNNSVFNPQENIYNVMMIESNDIKAMKADGFSSCTYAQYNYLALGQYQQSVDPIVSSCTAMTYGGPYATLVSGTSYYGAMAQHAVYGWSDEYE